MLEQLTLRGRIVSAALRLAARRPWQEISLLDISAEAGVPLLELKDLFASKSEIVAAFVGTVDEEMLRRAPQRMADAAARDMLFEVIMNRFDALQSHKSALRSIAAAPALDPALARALLASRRWMLHAAGVAADGIEGAVRVAGIAALYQAVFRIWLEDDDPGLARTMAALDRRLRRGERGMRAVEEFCGALGRLSRGLRPAPKHGAQPGADGRAASGGETQL